MLYININHELLLISHALITVMVFTIPRELLEDPTDAVSLLYNQIFLNGGINVSG